MAHDDDDWDGAGDFAQMRQGTVAEQRMRAGSSDGSTKSHTGNTSSSGGYPSRGSFRGIGKGVSKVAGGVSFAAGGLVGGVASVANGLTSSSHQANGQPASTVNSSTGDAYVGTKPAGASGGALKSSASVVKKSAGALMGGASAVTGGLVNGTKQVVAGSASVVTGATTLATGGLIGGVGAGSAAGEVSADIAVGLVAATLELFAACAPSCDTQSRADEIGALVDSVVASRSVLDLAIRLIDFWYILRPETLSDWSPPLQREWVHLAHIVKNGDLQRPRPLAKAICKLLLDLAVGCRQNASWFDERRSSTWLQTIRYYGNLLDGSALPPKWAFPELAIRRVQGVPDRISDDANPNDDDNIVKLDAKEQPSCFRLQRRDEKDHTGAKPPRAKGSELMSALSTSGKLLSRCPPVSMDASEETHGSDTFDVAREDIAPNPKDRDKGVKEGDVLFQQKMRPIRLLNQASVPLKICFFGESDFVCAIPVGGPGGPGVVLLEKGLRAQIRPPGSAERFKMKVFTPGLIDKVVYSEIVSRGQSVQLRSHNCVVE